MNTDPKLTTPEGQNGIDPRETLIALIGDLLAQQASPEAYGKLKDALRELDPALFSGQGNTALPEREGLKISRFPRFKSAQANILMEQAYPLRAEQPVFGIRVSGNIESGLLSPALPITPSTARQDLQEKMLDSMSPSRDSVQIDGIPSLPKAILDRFKGLDPTIKPLNKALVEISLGSFRYLKELLSLDLSDRAFLSIITPLVLRDFWNGNKTDPGGQTLTLPRLSETSLDISNLLGDLSPKGLREAARILPPLRKWLRLVQTQATAGLTLLEGDPFSGNLASDPSIVELSKALQAMQRSQGRFAHIPLSRDQVINARKHPLRKYAYAMKSWNSEDWTNLVEHPELIADAALELKELRKFRTVIIAAGTGAGKSTLAQKITDDRRLLLGENAPGMGDRFLGIGSTVIGLHRAGRNLESFKADSPFDVLFSAIERSQQPNSGTPDDTLVLMEIPPAVKLGLPPGESRNRSMSRQEISQMVCFPAHIGTRLLRNGASAEDLCDHDPEIAVTSSIGLSRIAGGNIEAVVVPMRQTQENLEIISKLSQIQPDRSEVWSAESTLSQLRAVFNALPADLRNIWWMSSITDAPLVPMVREFPGELTRDDMYNSDIGAIHYLLSLHNVGVLDLHADSNIFPREIGKFLPDGKINLRKLAMKIPQDSPLRSLITIADHLHDGLHGSGLTNTSQFLYGLALSLFTLSREKNIKI
jgi:hypothetical protein